MKTELKISSHQLKDSEIEILELTGQLTDIWAMQLYDYLYECFDEGRYYHLINFKGVKSMGGIAVNVLEELSNRGLNIALFAVNDEIARYLRQSDKLGNIQIYDEENEDVAVNFFTLNRLAVV